MTKDFFEEGIDPFPVGNLQKNAGSPDPRLDGIGAGFKGRFLNAKGIFKISFQFQGKPQIEIESVMEFARFNQIPIARFQCERGGKA